MEQKFCQSCGMPLNDIAVLGTAKGEHGFISLDFLFQPRVQRGSIGLAALHFHTQGALLVLNDGERAHTYFQLLFQLLERRFIILKLNSHFVSD